MSVQPPSTAAAAPASLAVQHLRQQASAHWVAAAIAAAVHLGVADQLPVNAGRSIADLAAACRADAARLHRLLRALASVGYFRCTSDGQWWHSAMSELLRDDHPESQRAFVQMVAGAQYAAWGCLADAVRAGGSDTAFTVAHSKTLFAHHAANPAEAQAFHRALADMHRTEDSTLAQWWPRLGMRSGEVLCDVGGGQGGTLAAILHTQGDLRGVVFDQAAAIAAAVAEHAALIAAGRLRTVAGDFTRDDLPGGVQAVLLKNVLHNWSDTDATRLLKAAHAALARQGLLLIAEAMLDPTAQRDPTALMDLYLLAVPGGQKRSPAQHQALLRTAGCAGDAQHHRLGLPGGGILDLVWIRTA